MVDLLDIQAEDSLLEVGTGRGYQTAVMAELEHHVWSIDIIEEFVEIAQSRMVVLDNENVTLRAGDGSRGWANAAPFDKIIVAAAADEPPDRLLEQLNPGGRLVIPLRRRGSSANHADCKGHRWLDGEAPSYPCEVLTFGISPSSARPERSKTAMASSLVPSYNWCGANGIGRDDGDRMAEDHMQAQKTQQALDILNAIGTKTIVLESFTPAAVGGGTAGSTYLLPNFATCSPN